MTDITSHQGVTKLSQHIATGFLCDTLRGSLRSVRITSFRWTVNILKIAQVPWESSQLIYCWMKKNIFRVLITDPGESKPGSVHVPVTLGKKKTLNITKISPLFKLNWISGIRELKVVLRKQREGQVLFLDFIQASKHMVWSILSYGRCQNNKGEQNWDESHQSKQSNQQQSKGHPVTSTGSLLIGILELILRGPNAMNNVYIAISLSIGLTVMTCTFLLIITHQSLGQSQYSPEIFLNWNESFSNCY